MLKEISILASNYAYYMLNLSFHCVSDWCLNFSIFAAESCLTWLIHNVEIRELIFCYVLLVLLKMLFKKLFVCFLSILNFLFLPTLISFIDKNGREYRSNEPREYA